MNTIIKEEITIVQNKEGAIFKVGDIVKKAVKGKTDHFEKPSKIISFNVRSKKNKNGYPNNLVITAITDFKYESGILNETGILIDKLELHYNPFPKCFKIRSLGVVSENKIFTDKINKILNFSCFSGGSSTDSYYFLNLDDLNQKGCGNINDNKFKEVTVEQFLKYCENEKI